MVEPNAYSTLKLNTLEDHILQVTLNRPERRNAINIDMMQELLTLWKTVANDPNPTRCIILTGTGDKAFCAGADLKARANMDKKTWREQHKVLQQAMLAMIACPVPIIVAANGAAFGGGLELTLAADFAYAAENAMFAQSEVKLGLIPGAMGTQNLAKACGLARARELTYTGEAFSAKQACEWGIVNGVYSQNELLPEVIAIANKIAANAPIAVRHAKQAIDASIGCAIATGYQEEVAAYDPLLDTQDLDEGIAAFNEKRKANFTGN